MSHQMLHLWHFQWRKRMMDYGIFRLGSVLTCLFGGIEVRTFRFFINQIFIACMSLVIVVCINMVISLRASCCMHTYIHTYIHTYTHINIQTYALTYKHTNAFIQENCNVDPHPQRTRQRLSHLFLSLCSNGQQWQRQDHSKSACWGESRRIFCAYIHCVAEYMFCMHIYIYVHMRCVYYCVYKRTCAVWYVVC